MLCERLDLPLMHTKPTGGELDKGALPALLARAAEFGDVIDQGKKSFVS